MAEVVVDVAGHEVVSAITRHAVERMGIAEGDDVVVLVKATEVTIGKP